MIFSQKSLKSKKKLDIQKKGDHLHLKSLFQKAFLITKNCKNTKKSKIKYSLAYTRQPGLKLGMLF